MMEARIPTRQWATYDLATIVAKDDKKQSRFHASHIEGDDAKPENVDNFRTDSFDVRPPM